MHSRATLEWLDAFIHRIALTVGHVAKRDVTWSRQGWHNRSRRHLESCSCEIWTERSRALYTLYSVFFFYSAEVAWRKERSARDERHCSPVSVTYRRCLWHSSCLQQSSSRELFSCLPFRFLCETVHVIYTFHYQVKPVVTRQHRDYEKQAINCA